ncbi:hypothetical protein HD806DRAFT_536040 [Xylariaceae sp. AK1471]|nr:hypothetical protein HD806DRAFT_536040 [Xylariaceae sp. AK1471]
MASILTSTSDGSRPSKQFHALWFLINKRRHQGKLRTTRKQRNDSVGLILWTFLPVHDNTGEKGMVKAVPPGTKWRFLTQVDPTSSYHQQQAYVSESPAILSRDNVMSPNPGYAHHINAAMHQNFIPAQPQNHIDNEPLRRGHHWYHCRRHRPADYGIQYNSI